MPSCWSTSKPITTGKRCDWRSQSRLFWIVGSVPGGWRLALTDAETDAAHLAVEHPTGQHVEQDLHRAAGLQMRPRLFSVNSALIQTS